MSLGDLGGGFHVLEESIDFAALEAAGDGEVAVESQALIGGELNDGGGGFGVAGAGLEAGGWPLLPVGITGIDILEDFAKAGAIPRAGVAFGDPGADLGTIRDHLAPRPRPWPARD